MKLTRCPCWDCQKRSVDCRLNCGRYKVYRYAKSKEYAQRLEERIETDASFERRMLMEKRRRKKRRSWKKQN